MIRSILEFKFRCVEKLLRHGFYEASEILLDELRNRKITFKDNLISSINTISKEMDTLYNKFSFDHTDFQV